MLSLINLATESLQVCLKIRTSESKKEGSKIIIKGEKQHDTDRHCMRQEDPFGGP